MDRTTTHNQYDFKKDLQDAVEVLRQGGLILYPTDTIWGIGCDPTKDDAVERIFRLKRRAESKSLILLVHSESVLPGIIEEIPPMAYELIDVSDGPLTLIYPGAKNLSSHVVAEDGSVAVRITREDFSYRLCQAYRMPIVSTSANISGSPSPRHFGEITTEILQGVDYIVSYKQGDRTEATPSHIIKIGLTGEVKVIR